MLPGARVLIYDNYRMSKQAISITLSPDNLLWLHGRARAEQFASLSEFLDRLITRARFGGDAPRVGRSMKGALAGLVAEPLDDAVTISPDAWHAWQARWDDLLVGIDTTSECQVNAKRLEDARVPERAIEEKPAPARRSRRA